VKVSPHRFTSEEHGLVLRRYWTNAWQSCALKRNCTPGQQRRIDNPASVRAPL
jgi:hypothetical protein